MSGLTTLTVYRVQFENRIGTVSGRMIPAASLEDVVKIFRKAYPKRGGLRLQSVIETDTKVHVL